MHTVNKAYSILQQEGFVKIDRRRGAVIAIDIDKLRALAEAKDDMSVIIARAMCKNIGRNEMIDIVNCIYDEYLEADR